MLDQINLHSSFKTNGAKLSKVYFAITDFVNELRERNVQDYNTFKDIYYGSILSKITDIAEINEINKKLPKITILLDSNFLFRVLELQNPYYNESSLELLELLKKEGFELRTLLKTVDEMRRVLNHRLSLIRKGKIPASMPESESQYIDGIIGAIYRRKMSSADIEEYIRNLERKIEKLGVKVDHYNVLSNITIDSKELKKYFKDKLLKYVNTKKLDEYDLDVDIDTIIAEEDIPKHLQDMVYRKCEIDLKTIQYISNQRRGDKFNLSDAKILMISCDWRYANYSYNPDIPQRINEVFLEDRLTNILWIKNPKLGDDIPLNLLYRYTKHLTLSILRSSHSLMNTLEN